MPQVKPEVETFARIKVIGVGGSGKNAINHMINSKVKGVDFLAINTDAQDLHHSMAKQKIHIGKNLTKGLGAGMNPEVGKRAAEETREEIQEALKNSDMVFVSGGFGGGTCTGAGPVVAKISKEMGALTVAVVSKPFSFEGQQRMRLAEQGLAELSECVDALIIIPNDKLMSAIAKETTAKQAFEMSDEVLKQAVEGISDLITTPGTVGNIDFADIRAVLENAGSALMGIGTASGENRATEAAKNAISSPLLDVSMHGAKGVLFSIAGGEDLTMWEIQEAAKIITDSVDPEAKIIFGTVKDEKLKKNEIRITVIAANFPDSNSVRRSLFDNTRAAGSNAPGQPHSTSTQQSQKQEPSEAETRGKIFNSISSNQQNANSTPPTKDLKIDEKKNDSTTSNPDDDDWAVPAFLRRSKLK